MPKLYTLKSNGKASVKMYADDHRPPHFHLWHPDWEVLVDLKTMAVFRGSAPKQELAEACAWVAENLEAVELKRRLLNERDD